MLREASWVSKDLGSTLSPGVSICSETALEAVESDKRARGLF